MSADSGLSVPIERSAVAASADPAASRRQGGRRPVAAPPGPANGSSPEAPLPPLIQPRSARPRRQGRRVRRVVRRVELWSVLKVSLVFNTVMLGVALMAVALLWGLANTTGLLDDVEGFLRDSGFENFRFEGDRMFRNVAYIGAVLTLAFTIFTVLAAALFNLISELTGGVRFVVIEELPPRPARSRPASSPGPAVQRAPGPFVPDPPGWSSVPRTPPPGFGPPSTTATAPPGGAAPTPSGAVAPSAAASPAPSAPRGRVARRRIPADPGSGIPIGGYGPGGGSSGG